MKQKRYIVQVKGINHRKEFINEMIEKYKLEATYNINDMSTSPFPFRIDFKEKTIITIESITGCAILSQNNQILSEENFKEILGGK